MADVVLFHHVQGLTTGVVALADRLRAAGHTVHTPDLFEGHTFPTIEEGMAHARGIGFGAIAECGVAAADALDSPGVVYAGLSMGVMPAQQLAQTRPGARGALLLHGCLPVAEFGQSWPAGVPVQVHGMDADPFFAEEDGDLAAARALVDAAPGDAELFLYPGDAHLFSDSSLPEFDAAATDQLVERALALLAGV
ncbi:dienelactone hydrolase family protein [Nocardioides nanhaiensis]|uniref:Dienelactone hydrolase family protein n=2 Tax=Nocardioides nanhaiensis TaxID=1476871 RepID=A0ABP8VVC0_9ACTN